MASSGPVKRGRPPKHGTGYPAMVGCRLSEEDGALFWSHVVAVGITGADIIRACLKPYLAELRKRKKALSTNGIIVRELER